jgi:hypothetical protein
MRYEKTFTVDVANATDAVQKSLIKHHRTMCLWTQRPPRTSQTKVNLPSA